MVKTHPYIFHTLHNTIKNTAANAKLKIIFSLNKVVTHKYDNCWFFTLDEL